ncbi:MAG: Npt1/Npt2 family nucleotide transporter [Bacteriovoracia bacterium]
MRIFQLLKSQDPRYKGHLWFFLGSYFFALFNYPMVRAAATTMFIEEFGAKSSPLAWIWTVVILTVTIFIFNKFQATHTVQKVLFVVSLLSTALLTISALGTSSGIPYSSYISFVWKEIYIVLQIHLLLGYANNFFHKDDFKFIIGPVGAVGSIGGILGGLGTSYIARKWGTDVVAWSSLIFVLMPSILFLRTPVLIKEERFKKKTSPLETLNSSGIRKYVFYLGIIVMLSQFVINIADFKFNLAFEQNIVLSGERTAFLGSVYTWTNFISLILQFVLLPFLLPRISERSLHLFIPLSYLICLGSLLLSGGELMLSVAMFYVYLKASDYSLFSGGKELLYQPLQPEQKYGAKYLTDMLVYRMSKALIAAVLIYLQTSLMLNIMMASFLLIWLVLVIRIFGIHRRLFS